MKSDAKAAKPTRTSTDRRAAQLDALILAAEQRIAAEGASRLRARDLAQDIGVALGAIYNIVTDLDELAALVAGRTLKRLDETLEAAALAAAAQGEPADRLVAVARAYLGFARGETNLWRSVFELRSTAGRDLPGWMANERRRMFRHIVEPLNDLMPRRSERERELFAHTLFTATHGIVLLGLEQRLFAVPPEAIEHQLDLLVRAVCLGLDGHEEPH